MVHDSRPRHFCDVQATKSLSNSMTLWAKGSGISPISNEIHKPQFLTQLISVPVLPVLSHLICFDEYWFPEVAN